MTLVPITSTEFARAARNLMAECTRLGMKAPSFRSPPRLLAEERSIRWSHGRAIVSVRLTGRHADAVFADMVDGCLASNDRRDDDDTRTALWAVVR